VTNEVHGPWTHESKAGHSRSHLVKRNSRSPRNHESKAGHSREVKAIPFGPKSGFSPPTEVDRLGSSLKEAPEFVLKTLVSERSKSQTNSHAPFLLPKALHIHMGNLSPSRRIIFHFHGLPFQWISN
ncbi:hypothetical protein AVEN_218070-1, partial [Araneus ventricosus]